MVVSEQVNIGCGEGGQACWVVAVLLAEWVVEIVGGSLRADAEAGRAIQAP